MTDRATVSRWLADYEAAWRSPGTAGLAGLFTPDASYLVSPYAEPVTGLAAIARLWEAEREGPEEIFTLAAEIVAVDGPVAVVRAEVRYGAPVHQEFRDLWLLRLGADGRCAHFEEWFWPRPSRSPGTGSGPGSAPGPRAGCHRPVPPPSAHLFQRIDAEYTLSVELPP